MSSFTDPLDMRDLPDGKHFQLLAEFDYHIGAESSPDIIHVPAGFVTDLTSVPLPLWFICPKLGKHNKAAVIHDYLYQSKLRTRLMADAVFCEALGVLGVSQWQSGLMYWGVRLFGWLGYAKNNLPKENE